jgi:hypothetical protein
VVGPLWLSTRTPDVLYALDTGAQATRGAIFESRDGGTRWQEVAPVAADASALVPDPGDSRMLYSGISGSLPRPRWRCLEECRWRHDLATRSARGPERVDTCDRSNRRRPLRWHPRRSRYKSSGREPDLSSSSWRRPMRGSLRARGRAPSAGSIGASFHRRGGHHAARYYAEPPRLGFHP